MSASPFLRPRSGLSRRQVLRGGALFAGSLAALPLLGACGDDSSDSAATGTSAGTSSEPEKSAGSSKAQSLPLVDWGGPAFESAKVNIFKPFTEETGIEIKISSDFPDNAKIKAMVDSGNVTWDIVDGDPSNVYNLGEEYFEEMPDKIKNLANIDEQYKGSHWAPFYVFATTLGWNTDLLRDGLDSWADFWDVDKFPGARMLAGAEGGVKPNLEFALLAAGVPMDKLYPLDVDKAFDMLGEIKPEVDKWWSTTSESVQALAGGQAAAAVSFCGETLGAKADGQPVDQTWNGGGMELATWVVPKGTPNADAAFQLIEYASQPEVQANVRSNDFNGPVNSKAFDTMDPDHAQTLPTYPDNVKQMFLLDAGWWGEHYHEVVDRFQEFALS